MTNNNYTGLYIFAIILFAIVIGLIVVLRKVFASNKRQAPSTPSESFEQEQRLFKLYQNLEDMMDSFESYVTEQREEIQRSVRYIQDVERKLQSVYAHLNTLSDQETRSQELKSSGFAPLSTREARPPISRVDLQTPDDDDLLSYTQSPAEHATQTSFVPETPPAEPPSSRHQRVLELYRAGKTPEAIARELNLTLGETSMIVAMSKEKYLW